MRHRRLAVWISTSVCFLFAGVLVAAEPLDGHIATVIDQPKYKHAHWGLLIADLQTGETLFELNADKLFAPASTTKLFSVAAALDGLGADFQFQTPVYARGELGAGGELAGELILVASGDLTFGGRTVWEDHGRSSAADANKAGRRARIAFTNSDHTYADFSATAETTSTDSTAGLLEIARQIKAAGISRVSGDVLIDDRLFDQARGTGSGPSLVTPIMVNDNVVDVLVTPGKPGEQAIVAVRPLASDWQLDARVDTVAADGDSQVSVSSPGDRKIIVRGKIPAGRKPVLKIVPIDDPASFARGLLIDALRQTGVQVEASSLTANRPAALPAANTYRDLKRVAMLTSPRFAESVRLILKVSHNLHASTLPLLLAARHGERTLEQGLRRQRDFLLHAGIDADAISFGGAAGGDRADYVTPRVAVQLLRYMSTRDDYLDYLDALPLLGVDGTLSSAVDQDSPARGKVQAKTGTLVWHNTQNGRYLLTSKALAGYLTTSRGERLAFGMFVNNVDLAQSADAARVGRDLGRLCEIIYEHGPAKSKP